MSAVACEHSRGKDAMRPSKAHSIVGGEMSKHLMCALACGAVLTMGLPSAASAAGAGFCRDYVRAALNQVRGGMNHRRCAVQMQGPRWSTDFSVHFVWCRGVSRDQAEAERLARERTLQECAH